MLTVTPMRFSERNSMMAGVSSVALVVRLKSMVRPCSAACCVGVSHHLLQQREIHERLAAEKRDVNRPAARGLRQQKIHRSLGRLEVHELRLAFRRRDFVLAEFVAILAGQIALVGEIHHQRLQREIGRQAAAAAAPQIHRSDDGPRLVQFLDHFLIGDRRQFLARGLALRQAGENGGRRVVQLEDPGARNKVQISAPAAFEPVKFAQPELAH